MVRGKLEVKNTLET